MNVASLVVSILALAVAGWAAWYARTQSKHAGVMAANDSKRLAHEEAAREATQERLRHADVEVRLQPAVRNEPMRRLDVYSRGPATAQDVSVSFVRPLSGDGGRDGAFDQIEGQRFDLRPGEPHAFALTPDFDTASRFEIALRWTDPSGKYENLHVIQL